MKILKLTVISLTLSVMLAGCQSTLKPIVTTTIPAQHAETQHSRPHWGYQSPATTPDRWGDVEVNKLCSLGQEQSPINITIVTKLSPNQFNLVSHYQAQDFVVTNNGHTIVYTAKNADDSHLNVNNTDYKLLQFHYHIPSEHTVMDNSYPLEIHFVHQNANKQLAVVGVLAKVGDVNANLQKIFADIPHTPKDQGVLTKFDVSSLMPTDSQTYAYNGSLTTPPCSEQVQWLLKSTPITLSQAQLMILSDLYQGNNRPVKPQGSQTVAVF